MTNSVNNNTFQDIGVRLVPKTPESKLTSLQGVELTKTAEGDYFFCLGGQTHRPDSVILINGYYNTINLASKLNNQAAVGQTGNPNATTIVSGQDNTGNWGLNVASGSVSHLMAIQGVGVISGSIDKGNGLPGYYFGLKNFSNRDITLDFTRLYSGNEPVETIATKAQFDTIIPPAGWRNNPGVVTFSGTNNANMKVFLEAPMVADSSTVSWTTPTSWGLGGYYPGGITMVKNYYIGMPTSEYQVITFPTTQSLPQAEIALQAKLDEMFSPGYFIATFAAGNGGMPPLLTIRGGTPSTKEHTRLGDVLTILPGTPFSPALGYVMDLGNPYQWMASQAVSPPFHIYSGA